MLHVWPGTRAWVTLMGATPTKVVAMVGSVWLAQVEPPSVLASMLPPNPGMGDIAAIQPRVGLVKSTPRSGP
jgi:hypothetical protein